MTVTRIATNRARLVAWALPALVGLWVVVNAWPGLMPGVGFWDTGEFQAVLPVMGTAHPTGYPTYVLLGWLGNLLLAPIGEPAFRVTALSLIAVAVAAAATVALVRRLTGSSALGVAAGIGLATTSLVWANATRADPHALHLAFVALLLLALVRWADGPNDGLDRRGRGRHAGSGLRFRRSGCRPNDHCRCRGGQHPGPERPHGERQGGDRHGGATGPTRHPECRGQRHHPAHQLR